MTTRARRATIHDQADTLPGYDESYVLTRTLQVKSITWYVLYLSGLSFCLLCPVGCRGGGIIMVVIHMYLKISIVILYQVVA